MPSRSSSLSPPAISSSHLVAVSQRPKKSLRLIRIRNSLTVMSWTSCDQDNGAGIRGIGLPDAEPSGTTKEPTAIGEVGGPRGKAGGARKLPKAEKRGRDEVVEAEDQRGNSTGIGSGTNSKGDRRRTKRYRLHHRSRLGNKGV